MVPGFTLGTKLNKSLNSGFTLGKNAMRLLATNQEGFEIQIFTLDGWQIAEGGFKDRPSADLALLQYKGSKFEYRVYPSLK